MDEPIRAVKWSELSAQERYRVVVLARKGEIEVSQLCQSFGVSRQTLYRAMEAVERAAIEALEAKRRGRKPKSVSGVQAKELMASNASLQQELEHWKTKYEVAKSFIELERQLERERSSRGGREKKRRTRRPRAK